MLYIFLYAGRASGTRLRIPASGYERRKEKMSLTRGAVRWTGIIDQSMVNRGCHPPPRKEERVGYVGFGTYAHRGRLRPLQRGLRKLYSRMYTISIKNMTSTGGRGSHCAAPTLIDKGQHVAVCTTRTTDVLRPSRTIVGPKAGVVSHIMQIRSRRQSKR